TACGGRDDDAAATDSPYDTTATEEQVVSATPSETGATTPTGSTAATGSTTTPSATAGTTGSTPSTDTARSASQASSARQDQAQTGNRQERDSATMVLDEERLDVQKREVDQGGVLITKNVETK